MGTRLRERTILPRVPGPEDSNHLIALGRQSSDLSLATLPQVSQENLICTTFGLHRWRALVELMPQYSQLWVFVAMTGLQRCPLSGVTRPQVEQV